MKPIHVRPAFVGIFLFSLGSLSAEINTQQPDHPHLLAQRVRPRNRSEAPAVAEPAQPAPAEAAQPQAAPPLQVD